MEIKAKVSIRLQSLADIVPLEHQTSIATGQWYIFNAARPLPGHLTWMGDFYHGCFYAAVNVAEEYAASYGRQCVELDGYVVQCVTEEQVRAEVQAYFDAQHPDLHIQVADYAFNDVLDSYVAHCYERETVITL